MIKRLLTVVLSLFVVTAHAQFTPGQILTASQLNSQFSLYVPMAGGTLTGPLTVPSLNVTTPIAVASGGTGATSVSAAIATANRGTTGRSIGAHFADTVFAADYGVVCDGVTDIGPALNALVSTLAPGQPSIVRLPAGVCRIATAVTFNNVAPILEGHGYTEGPNPSMGTWIKIDQTGFVPFTFSGSTGRGAIVRNLAVYQVQPAPGAGWAPTGYDYVFKVLNTLGQITFDNVLLAGVTNGIYADNSGRLNIESVYGQVYTNGIQIDDCYDIPRINYAHFWTYVTSDPNVVAYQEANTDAIILKRVDGIYLGDIFGLAARSVIHMTSGTNGVTTKAYLSNLYADFSQYGVWIDGPGSTIQVANATTQHNDFNNGSTPLAGSYGLYVNTTNTRVQLGNWRTDLAQSSAINISGYANIVSATNLFVNGYDSLADGSPAVYVADSASNTPNTFNLANVPVLSGTNIGPLSNTSNASVTNSVPMNVVGNSVNTPRFYSATSGNGVSTSPVGSDASIDYIIAGKGSTGGVRLQANGGQTIFRVDNPSSGDTDILLRSGVGAASFTAESSSANATINLNPKGTGSVAINSNASVSGTLSVSGTSVKGALSGTTTSIGGSALAAGACASGTVAVTNSTTAMGVVATPATYPGDGIFWHGYVSAAGTVTVKVCASVAATPTASAYNVRVLQ